MNRPQNLFQHICFKCNTTIASFDPTEDVMQLIDNNPEVTVNDTLEKLYKYCFLYEHTKPLEWVVTKLCRSIIQQDHIECFMRLVTTGVITSDPQNFGALFRDIIECIYQHNVYLNNKDIKRIQEHSVFKYIMLNILLPTPNVHAIKVLAFETVQCIASIQEDLHEYQKEYKDIIMIGCKDNKIIVLTTISRYSRIIEELQEILTTFEKLAQP